MNETTIPIAPGGEAGDGDPDDPRAMLREMLVDHAVSLDGIFADLTDYAAQTFRNSPFAAQAYLRLALRAQSSCRSSLEAVVRAERVRAGGDPAAAGADAAPGAGDPASRAPRAPVGRAARHARRDEPR